MEPWQWPDEAADTFLRTITDKQARTDDRMLAAELAGDPVVINDELATALLSIAEDADNPVKLRSRAIVSLGPVLELAEWEDYDFLLAMPISEERFQAIQETLYILFHDANVAKEVRKAALEASVRSQDDWHEPAVQNAYDSDDREWKQTAVFCMQFLPGFEKHILDALKSPSEEILYCAVRAAGNWEIAEAWEHISSLAASKKTDKELRLAAIEALGTLEPMRSQPLLLHLVEDNDDEVSETAMEALGMAEAALGSYDDLDDEDDLD
jgi:hypothetical protein